MTHKTLTMRLTLQQTAAAAAVTAVAARAPSQQANERRMAKKEKTATYIGQKGRNKNTYVLAVYVYSTASLHCRGDLIL